VSDYDSKISLASKNNLAGHLRPNVIIGGTGRAGSTSLFRYLTAHPAVCGSKVKETGFFLRSDLRAHDIPWVEYEKFFTHCKKHHIIRIEGTPHYLHEADKAAPLIANAFPNLKLIFILRNPAERLYTIYRNLVMLEASVFGNLTYKKFALGGIESFQKASKQSDEYCVRAAHYIKTGCYVDFLTVYFKLIPKKQIYVDFFENLKDDPKLFMERVSRFLGIDGDFYEYYNFTIENKTRSYRIVSLDRFVRGVNKIAEPLLNRHPLCRQRLRALYTWLNEQSTERVKLDEDVYTEVANFYAPYNCRLFDFLSKICKHREIYLPPWLDKLSNK
jgi:hypothetical protein